MLGLLVVGCGDNINPPVCELAQGGASRPIGARTVVATLPGAGEYGEMVVTPTQAYVVANNDKVRLLRRIDLSTGATEVLLTTVNAEGEKLLLRAHGDRVAWNHGGLVTIATASGTTTVAGVPAGIVDFDFDAHHVFVAPGGQHFFALGIDGSQGASWSEFAFAVRADGAGGVLLANCMVPGVWRVQIGAELDPVPAPRLCAIGLVTAAQIALVTAYSDCGEYGVYRVDPSTGETSTLIRGGPHDTPDVAFLRADADEAYYITGGSLVRIPVDGGEPVEVLAGARTFALGADAIFAIVGDQLVRIAKTEK